MKLIEDLGRKPVGSQGQYTRYGLYECPVCLKHFRVATNSVKGGGATKCRSCADISRNLLRRTVAADTFILRCINIHSDTYDYSLVNYICSKTKVKIICKTHGVFEQTPNSHLSGQGCYACSKPSYDTQSFVDCAGNQHGDTYDYHLVDYIDSATKVKIICKTHGEFLQTTGNHLSGQGCPSCAVTGFKKNKPAILYYLKIITVDQILYKIGITNRTISARFSVEELKSTEVLWTKNYESGEDCYDEEQRILKESQGFRYIGIPVLYNGNTELFTIDILPNGIDTKETLDGFQQEFTSRS
jgi:hypothetical protein